VDVSVNNRIYTVVIEGMLTSVVLNPTFTL
jgi:hypothetical protein